MISLNLKNLLTLLLIGFTLGFCSSCLFTGCDKSSASSKKMVVKPKELKKQAEAIQENYHNQITVLQDQNLQLQQNLEATQALLDRSKQICKQKEQQIKKLTGPKRFLAKDLLAKVDTLKAASNCDTLANLVVEYIVENNLKDSLFEIQLTQMDSAVSVKDKLIDANEKAYTNVNILFNQCLKGQETILKENKLLLSKFERQRFKNKVITVGLMILTATASNYLLHH